MGRQLCEVSPNVCGCAAATDVRKPSALRSGTLSNTRGRQVLARHEAGSSVKLGMRLVPPRDTLPRKPAFQPHPA